MNQTLYLECYSGISGDMTVAALLDLGADQRVLEEGLKSLGLEGYQIRISRVKKGGIDACDFDVLLEQENHDHDMGYLHGASGEKASMGHHHTEKAPEHVHGGSSHEHGHGEKMHTHPHVHRGLKEILEIIEHSEMTVGAKEIAVRIFSILADAEAKAHGVELYQVHFHEVGAVDSIVDIAAAAICLDNLNITNVIVPELYEGKGVIRCQHGLIPVPVPAVTGIVTSHGIKLHITEVSGELVTPTGAAIVAAIRTEDTLPQRFSVKKIGLGAGKRAYKTPGILRAMLIEQDKVDGDVIYRLESNIDDCTGEMLGYVMERLLEEGARDVSYTPVYMKKNRPAYQLNVICSEADVYAMEQVIFQETTTIGIRRMKMERSVLRREICEVETSMGPVRVKVCQLFSGVRYYAEYEDVAELSRRYGKPYYEVYLQVQRELKEIEKDFFL